MFPFRALGSSERIEPIAPEPRLLSRKGAPAGFVDRRSQIFAITLSH
jgi:hypothetical protein